MEFFSLRHRVKPGSGVHPASYPVDTGGSFPGGKATGREVNHTPAFSTEVKYAWKCTSTPQYVFMAWYLVKLYLYLYVRVH